MSRAVAFAMMLALAACAGRGPAVEPGPEPAAGDPPPGAADPAPPAADAGPPQERDAAPDTADAAPSFGFSAPRALSESRFNLADSRRYADASQGYYLRYQGPERPGVDVYVYPAGEVGEEPSDDERRRIVREQFEQAVSEIRIFAERDLRVLDLSFEPRELEVPAREGSAAGLHRRIGFRDAEGPPRDSHLIVLGLGEAVLKFRSTFPEERREEGWAHVDALVREFAENVVLGEEAARAAAQAADSVPESFDVRAPRLLPESRYQGTQSQRHQNPARGLLLTYQGPERPQVQLFVIPLVYPTPPEDERIADSVRARRLAEEVDNELAALQNLAQTQEMTILDDAPEPSELELETQYGPAVARRHVVRLQQADEQVVEIHLVLFTVEHQLLKARSIIPEQRREDALPHLHAFVEELASTILATRPPPEEDPPGEG